MDSNLSPVDSKTEALQPGDYVRLLQMLLQSISKNAVVTTPQKLESFRERVDAVAKNLTEFADSSTFGPGIESVIQSLEEHHRDANQLLQKARQTAASAGLTGPASIDPTTGLPIRGVAEQTLIARLNKAGGEFVVALFVVDRLPTINARFGRAMGDKVLTTVAEHLNQKVSQIGQLMRWGGPGFMTLLEVTGNWHQLERDIKRIASFRLQFEMSSAGRSTMLPLTCGVHLHKVNPATQPEILFQELDELLAANPVAAA